RGGAHAVPGRFGFPPAAPLIPDLPPVGKDDVAPPWPERRGLTTPLPPNPSLPPPAVFALPGTSARLGVLPARRPRLRGPVGREPAFAPRSEEFGHEAEGRLSAGRPDCPGGLGRSGVRLPVRGVRLSVAGRRPGPVLPAAGPVPHLLPDRHGGAHRGLLP